MLTRKAVRPCQLCIQARGGWTMGGPIVGPVTPSSSSSSSSQDLPQLQLHIPLQGSQHFSRTSTDCFRRTWTKCRARNDTKARISYTSRSSSGFDRTCSARDLCRDWNTVMRIMLLYLQKFYFDTPYSFKTWSFRLRRDFDVTSM